VTILSFTYSKVEDDDDDDGKSQVEDGRWKMDEL